MICACVGSSSFLFRSVRSSLLKNMNVVEIDRRMYDKLFDGRSDIGSFFADVDVIVNFAWKAEHFTQEIGEHDYPIDAEILGILPATCRAKFVTISSRQVYAPMRDAPVNEKWNIYPTTTYGRNKLMAEQAVQSICDMQHRKWVVLRCSNIFGFEYPEKRNRFFSIMLRSLRDRGLIELEGQPDRLKDVLPVEVFAKVLVGVVKKEFVSGFYNVGSGIGISLRSLASALIDGFGSGVIVEVRPDRIDPSFVLDISKICSFLGCKEKIDMLGYIREYGRRLKEWNG